MPFFLVTHTSLLEADDEQAAAHEAVNTIRRGQEVTVIVKSDEETALLVTVEAKVHSRERDTRVAMKNNDQV
ncbi:hypothetical protein AGR7A_pTi0065 [Agrobacterium deltaense NCPPB 1641]|uniref:Uncharacterized protein n=2 Tax=Rhizobium/Agrobacterium group TaxID=227290 RepID=A0A1S7UC23_9HYPH|nr:hypothetical protein AGR7A_pTi0065 [Agrobacterium deltaense NCPPB 1641]